MSSLTISLVGQLVITIVKARDLVDKEMLGTMSPMVRVFLDGDHIDRPLETQPVHHGGTNPDFNNHEILFNCTGKEQKIHVQVLDKTTFGHKDIGEFKCELDELNFSGEPHWYKLTGMHTAGKEEGEIALAFKFTGTGLPETHKKHGHGRGKRVE